MPRKFLHRAVAACYDQIRCINRAKASIGIPNHAVTNKAKSCNSLFFMLGLGASEGQAELLIQTTGAWDGSEAIGNLPPGKIWGQTFTAPTGASQLSQASFWVQPYPLDWSNLGPYAFDMTAYLMSWDGQKGTQPLLADSFFSVSALPWQMTRVDFTFQNADVTPNSQYVVFFEYLAIGSAELCYDGRHSKSLSGRFARCSLRRKFSQSQ
jgi:hypothetical protein